MKRQEPFTGHARTPRFFPANACRARTYGAASAVRNLALAELATLAILVAGTAACSFNVVPVAPNKVNSAKLAEQPLLRGRGAPRSFDYVWKLSDPTGVLFDPSLIEFGREGAHFHAPPDRSSVGRERVGVFVLQAGPWYEALDSFNATVMGGETAGQGFARFQLSADNSAWFYHTEKGWVPAGPTYHQANSGGEIQEAIGRFHMEVGTGALVLKVFLVQPTGAEKVALLSVGVGGISPRIDGWN